MPFGIMLNRAIDAGLATPLLNRFLEHSNLEFLLGADAVKIREKMESVLKLQGKVVK